MDAVAVDFSEAPESFQRQTDDCLGEGASMTWHMAGADATRDQLRGAEFRVTDEWPAPEQEADEPPQPPLFEAVLDG